MTRPPDFDDLVGELEPGEHDRLLRVHDMLLEAGPPPELTPELEAGPTLGMTLRGRTKRGVQRRTALIAAAVVVLLLAFLGGYITGNDQSTTGRVLQLHGTPAAPKAQASLRIHDADTAGNWPMELAALGLPKLPSRAYYEVFLVRNNTVWLPCGSFVVKSAKVGVSVKLNAPYTLRNGDRWVVTRQVTDLGKPGPVVLKPTV